MISDFLHKAEEGKPVYINTVHDSFQRLGEEDSETLNCVLTLLDNKNLRLFPIKIPSFSGFKKSDQFIKEYM